MATAGAGRAKSASRPRELVHDHPDCTFHQANVTGIDLDAKSVTVEGCEPIDYDYLVLGLGAVVNFFGTKGAAEHAFPLYTLQDAVTPEGAHPRDV